MHEKVLWKIEALWNEYFNDSEKSNIDIGKYYENNISKYYKKFQLVDSFDFSESDEVVFSDDYGDYKGLQKLQVSLTSGKPVYLVDNHNEMLYGAVETCDATGKFYDIVHIDAHPDDANFEGEKAKSLGLNGVEDYIQKTRISDFFDSISETKMIENIFRVTHSDNFEFFLPPEKPYMLSLDIDIFGPEGDFAELKDKVRAIALAWAKADAVCIAMSPGFIDQEYAKEIIKIMTKS